MRKRNEPKRGFSEVPESIRGLQAAPPKPMAAFHGSEELRRFYLSRVRCHQEADEIVKGRYWEDGKGCAVGCCIHGDNHSRYETELGIPVQLAYLQDGLFEGLSNEEALKFPFRFLNAIPVGVDLQPVIHRFLHWLLVDPEHGVVKFACDYPQGKKAIEDVAALHYLVMMGQPVQSAAWSAAWAAAWSSARDATRTAARDATKAAAWAAARADVRADARTAARDAARAAARAAARTAAKDADEAAARDAVGAAAWAAARDAAWDAAEDADEDEVWDAAVKNQKEKLLQFLREAE